ncbi:ribonuclease III [Blautia liquoris]|uniref:Ribonuclease 3 n=1 Tax=Blautia liquoris TaxID=2779518 RepID=A0A7M2RJG7_9FIRM|nr:ribonuclease III [Blautia liquoris]QOV20463.1 ribonuclease III [Blautia liquoris]
MNKTDRLKELEKRIEYRFLDFSLLEMAMRHSSYTNEHKMSRLECNERLEFLGDAVLEVVSSEFLYNMYPDKPEGELTKMRASLVCEPTLAYDAREIDLGSFLLLGKGEEATGGRNRDSVTSDAFESIIGAIFLDGGFANAKEFILAHVLDDVEHKQLFYDSKTILQEIIQGEKEGDVTYVITGEKGPDHNKSFDAAVLIETEKIGEGSGKTKKAAEQQAAYDAICKIKKSR